MISYGANLGLMLNAATGEVHDVALRGFLRGVDGLVQPNVKGYLTNTPPGSPSDGDVYIIGAAPTGAWAGNAGKVARWYANDGAWDFYTPKNGWMLQSNSAREVYRYTGGAWEIFYQEGVWSPSATDLGGSDITYPVAKYTRVGNRADYTFKISGTGLTSTAGSTRISLPFTPYITSVCCASNDLSTPNYGTGISFVNGNAYLPTISSTGSIIVSGNIFI